MATRFYISSQLVPEFTPPIGAGTWGSYGTPTPRQLIQGKSVAIGGGNYEDTPASFPVTNLTVSSPPKSAERIQGISAPLAAQTINGTVKGQLQAWLNDAAFQACAAVIIRVIGADGTVRGTLLSYVPETLTSAFTVTKTNRAFPPSSALTEVVCQDGDRLVIEIGLAAFSTTTSGADLQTYLNPALGDLPEDETTTTELNSWIEFSQTLTFLTASLGRLYFPPYQPGLGFVPSPSPDWGYSQINQGRNNYYPLTSIHRLDVDASNDCYGNINPSHGGPPISDASFQFVSKALAAQTIEGTVKGQFQAYYGSWAAFTGCPAIVIRVVADDGTVRGTLLSYIPGTAPSTVFTANKTNCHLPSLSDLTSVEVQEGDHLVVEVGVVAFTNLSSYPAGIITITSKPSVGDLPEDETTTTVLNSWIEFSQPIKYLIHEGIDAPQDYTFQGNIGLSLTPSAVAYQGTLFQGNIGLSLTPEGRAFADYIFQGDVTLSLYPYWIVFGDIQVSLTPEGRAFADYLYASEGISLSLTPSAIAGRLHRGNVFCSLVSTSISNGPPEVKTDLVGSGGFAFGGQGNIFAIVPPKNALVGSGGLALSGEGQVKSVNPPILTFLGKGGFLFSGSGLPPQTVQEITPAFPPFSRDGAGLVLGGAGLISCLFPPVVSIVGDGGFVFGEVRIAPAKLILPATTPLAKITDVARLVLGGKGTWNFFYPPVQVVGEGAATFLFSGEGGLKTQYPLIVTLVGEGGFILGGGDIDNLVKAFDAWVLTGDNLEPSFFSNFNFNSFAQFQGGFYAAKADGLYLLDGPDDDGIPIRAATKIGPVSFGTTLEKRLRCLRPGVTGGPVMVTVATERKAGTFYQENNLVPVSRDIQGKEFTFDIMNFEELSQLDLIPLVLIKR